MQIEHISGSYRRQIRNRKNVVVRYGGQQDASTSKVSLVSQPGMCHNSPPISNRVNPSQLQKSQRYPEKVNAGQQAKSQRSSRLVNPLTSISVPNSTAFQNRTSHKFSAQLDHALTKVNAGQTFCKTLTAENRPSTQPYCFVLLLLHRCGLSSSSKELVLNQMREDVVSCVVVKCSPTLPVFISIIGVCDTSAGGVKP